MAARSCIRNFCCRPESSSLTKQNFQYRFSPMKYDTKRLKSTQAASNCKFGFLFDIDGVIVRGKRLLPHAREAFRLLTDKWGKFVVPALFVTNAGNMLRQTKAEQLSQWLGVKVDKDQVVMSHSPLRMFRQFHDKHVLVSGQGPLGEIAKITGFTNITTVEQLRERFAYLDTVDHARRTCSPKSSDKLFPRLEGLHPSPPSLVCAAIVLFGEPVRWETNLQLILDVLMSGGHPALAPNEIPYPHIPLLACNMDLLYMSDAKMPRFGHGCFLVCLENLYQKITGRELKYTALVGKPSELTYHHADWQLRQHALSLGLHQPETIYCIGDNPETDIYGANLYDRSLKKRDTSRARLRQSLKTFTTRRIGNEVATLEEHEELDDLDVLNLDGLLDNHADSCESILVCTGLYHENSNYVQFQGSMSDHQHRDQVLDADLKIPKFISPNILDAVRLVFGLEKYSNV